MGNNHTSSHSMKSVSKNIKTIGYTFAALIAFAANSVLCRMALKDGVIDASSFTAVRLLSGVLMFLVLLRVNGRSDESHSHKERRNKKNALMLFIYALSFSYAYISLDTGVGALILFGSVQLTMIMMSIFKGKKLHITEWLGVAISFSGLVYLVTPTLTTPSLSGFILMIMSGIAWGLYTLAGRDSIDPIRDTAYNFRHTVPFIIILVLITYPITNMSSYGVMLAFMSGALASALGYTIWYSALNGLTEIEAAVVQLSVPILASIGGVLFISEPISLQLIIACVLVLGGILTVVISRWLRTSKAQC